jgi:hypothetical protein
MQRVVHHRRVEVARRARGDRGPDVTPGAGEALGVERVARSPLTRRAGGGGARAEWQPGRRWPRRSAVLPEPGEPMMLSASTRSSRKCSRRCCRLVVVLGEQRRVHVDRGRSCGAMGRGAVDVARPGQVGISAAAHVTHPRPPARVDRSISSVARGEPRVAVTRGAAERPPRAPPPRRTRGTLHAARSSVVARVSAAAIAALARDTPRTPCGGAWARRPASSPTRTVTRLHRARAGAARSRGRAWSKSAWTSDTSCTARVLTDQQMLGSGAPSRSKQAARAEARVERHGAPLEGGARRDGAADARGVAAQRVRA